MAEVQTFACYLAFSYLRLLSLASSSFSFHLRTLELTSVGQVVPQAFSLATFLTPPSRLVLSPNSPALSSFSKDSFCFSVVPPLQCSRF